ncbi:MAG: redoxin family protein [Lachnospiraceae bacterium]|nr:redoxin family protein [Lachnospiraceae bacterium]
MKKLINGLRPMTCLFLALLLLTAVLTGCESTVGENDVTKVPANNASATTGAGVPTGETVPTEKPEKFPNRPNADTRTGTKKELAEGDVAPEFSVTLLDGSIFRMSDHDDGMVLLNFWATWCGPCVKEMPDLQKLANDGIENFTVCCLSVSDPITDVKQFCKQNSYSDSLFSTVEGTAIGDYYPSDYIPYTLLIKDGIIKKIYVGSRSYQDYRKDVDAVIGK